MVNKIIEEMHKKMSIAARYTPTDKRMRSMYSFTVTHESRNLKQARPRRDQYVDLLRGIPRLLLPHRAYYITTYDACQAFLPFFATSNFRKHQRTLTIDCIHAIIIKKAEWRNMA